MMGFWWWYLTAGLLSGLLVTTGSIKTKDEDLVDPYAWDYDRSTKTNRGTDDDWIKPGRKVDCSSDHVKSACSGCGYGLEPGESLPAEKQCDSDLNLFHHVTRSISKNFEQYPDTDGLVLTLSSYQRGKLLKFVDGEDISKVDIKDMLTTSWSVPDSPGSSAPFTILGLTKNEVVVGCLVTVLSVTIFMMVLTFHISFLRVLVSLCFTAMVISFIWSYMFLYQQKMAKRMSDDASRDQYNEICQSSKNASLLSGIWRFFRRGDDPCEKYFHDHQVHIALEVLPVDAITHTLGAIMFSVSGFFGASLAEISGGFLGSLPFAMWLPAIAFLLIFVVAILAVCLYCGGRRQHVHEQGPERIEPPAQRYAVDDGSREGARYRNRGDDRLEEAHPPRYAITDSVRDDADYKNHEDERISETGRQRQGNIDAPRDQAYYRNRGDDRLEEARSRSNDMANSSREDLYERDDKIDKTPPQIYAGEEGTKVRRYDRRNLDRGLQGTDDVIRGHPDRKREDKSNLRQRGLTQTGDIRDQEWPDDAPIKGDNQGRYDQISDRELENNSRGGQATAKTVSRDNRSDDLEQERAPLGDETKGGSGEEGRVEEIGQKGAGDQKELKNDDQSPAQSLPDSTGAEIKQISSETTDLAAAAAEEYSSEDDFEVIPEE